MTSTSTIASTTTVRTRIGQAHAHAHQCQQGYQRWQGHRQHRMDPFLGHQSRERRVAHIKRSHQHRPIGDPTGVVAHWAKFTNRHPHQKCSRKNPRAQQGLPSENGRQRPEERIMPNVKRNANKMQQKQQKHRDRNFGRDLHLTQQIDIHNT